MNKIKSDKKYAITSYLAFLFTFLALLNIVAYFTGLLPFIAACYLSLPLGVIGILFSGIGLYHVNQFLTAILIITNVMLFIWPGILLGLA